MLYKRIVPQASDFGGQDPVQILKISSKGLDKTASMQKRAAAFQKQIAQLKPMDKKAYLHVITTGSMQHFGVNRNCFVAGTKVLIENGTKNIQQIKPGQLVRTGSGQLHKVIRSIASEYAGDLVSVEVQGLQEAITMTADHPVFKLSRSQWIEREPVEDADDTELLFYTLEQRSKASFGQACELQCSDRVVMPVIGDQTCLDCNKLFLPVVNVNVFKSAQPIVVYNLEVDEEHTFCVPFIVHNCDGWNQDSFVYRPPMPKNASCKQILLDGGLKKYHNTYLNGAAVYQEHQTDKEKSGVIKAAAYNEPMHRGELLIEVDTDKWADRLNKKASGQDIYLSVGASLPRDTCFPKGTLVLTEKGYAPIEELQIGDIVKSASGSWQPVQKVFKHHDTRLTRISVFGLPEVVECTQSHPVNVVKADRLKDADPQSQYIKASAIQVGDYIKVRIDQSVEEITAGPYAAYLCGKQAGNEVIEKSSIESEASELCSETSYTVKDILNWSKDWKLAFVSGCLDSNGTVDRDKNEASVHTVNRKLALELQRILWSVGIPAEVRCNNNKKDEASQNAGYSVLIKNHVEQLQTYSSKALHCGTEKVTDACEDLILKDGYAYSRVTSVQNIVRDPTLVYNIQVALDHTYNAQGMDVHNCTVCGHQAHTLDQHCDHVKKHAGMILQDGTKIGMINDSPKFYDISGVDVPADQMAFVLRKIASGDSAAKAIEASKFIATRPPMSFSKAASILHKLAQIEKQLECKVEDDPLFRDEEQAVEDFIKAVENYPSDQVLDQCHRKSILLSPKMLFRIIGKEFPEKDIFYTYADNCPCCGKHLMQDMENDPQFAAMLRDGSFDTTLPVDMNLEHILQKFVPQFGVSRPALNGKSIRIVITSMPPEKDLKPLQQALQSEQETQDKKEEKIQKTAQLAGDLFRRTYARYVLSFAARNDQDTCNLAMQKLARYK